jgi:hypothetical protein
MYVITIGVICEALYDFRGTVPPAIAFHVCRQRDTFQTLVT